MSRIFGAIRQNGYAVRDVEAHPGTVIELSEVSGPKGRFFEPIASAAADCDGAEPVRRH